MTREEARERALRAGWRVFGTRSGTVAMVEGGVGVVFRGRNALFVWNAIFRVMGVEVDG